ncbi:hypothetical protein BAN44_5705 [Bacillus anthracis]|uniref:Uncharacterized protein pXO2-67/BXB0090/GBAA_pXO2_0090 n=1 Tax=Bacillus anthracis TaxID=1392 RepID=Y6590_BACAN|nr:hypothetical protein [Bacillus anthracis]Q9RMW7.2 RecName: Full=Uncharacterized protein pXO2-67/BXB0090/GBAA_pXO2_0090 [Bacillus anthracis]AAM26241.1 hypothetical protein BX_B0090 [Bacillus anthracis str. A2012]AAT29020.2 conserved hypothetical protein [Bacillus anthracis str. 'Ames Ancestor']ADK08332.1 conserved hypothetical protein [Bacillus cereus biovar anthracis str. CI]AFH87156.1 Hypothetical Protein H9401_5771 [Bacillus anthracis str. H9401]AHK41914.1 hypothetical protein BAPAT_pXO2
MIFPLFGANVLMVVVKSVKNENKEPFFRRGLKNINTKECIVNILIICDSYIKIYNLYN